MIDCNIHDDIKMQNHFVLLMAIKSPPGSSNLITILNNFGHGISNGQAEDAETAIAEYIQNRKRLYVLSRSLATK